MPTVAWRITLIYILVAALWIFLSDRIVGILIDNANDMARIQTSKGIAFIIVTASLLFLMLQRELSLRQRTLLEVQKNEERFRSVLQAATEGILLVDKRQHILMVNQAVETIFGYPQTALVGQHLSRLIPDMNQAQHQQYFQTYLATPVTRSMGTTGEVQGKRQDGSVFPAEINLSPLQTEGEMLVIALVADVSARKEADAITLQAQKLELELAKERELRQLKNLYVAMLTHDFRTPLAVIRSSADILHRYNERLSEADRQAKYQRIFETVTKMNQMLEDVMKINQSDMGKITLEPQVLDVTIFCQEIIDLLHSGAYPEREVRLFTEGDLKEVPLDRNLMHYVLTNLLTNALKYSPPDSPVELHIARDTDKVCFVVRDFGIGIPLEDQPIIFEPFKRASNARAIQGTGLGLVIVKDYVTLHGGSIVLESQEGQGTTFSVKIPLASAVLAGG